MFPLRLVDRFFPPSRRRPGSNVDLAAQCRVHHSKKVRSVRMTLPYSGAIFIQVFPRECTETFFEGHKRAFEFFGGLPRRIATTSFRPSPTINRSGRSVRAAQSGFTSPGRPQIGVELKELPSYP